MNSQTHKFLFCVTASLALLLTTSPASAALTFFYDPATGNLSFDTTDTRSGEIYVYGLSLNPSVTDITFNLDNFIKVFGSGFPPSTHNTHIGDASFSQPVEGLFTVGDVLPNGLTEETWSNLFSLQDGFGDRDAAPGRHAYSDVVGGGTPPPADFVYGRPDGDFDNRWDLIDPLTLSWAETATLIYRQADGEVILDTTGEDGGYISAFLLQSSNGLFLPEGFTHFFDGPFNQLDSHTIAQFADAIEPGEYSLGKILSPGLSEAEFSAEFNKATFLGLAGFSGRSFDFEADGSPLALAYLAVPEPAALILSLMAFVLVVAQNRLVNSC